MAPHASNVSLKRVYTTYNYSKDKRKLYGFTLEEEKKVK